MTNTKATKLPLRQDISSVSVVTISADEYAQLLDCRRRLAEYAAATNSFEAAHRSSIERDPEVATFLAERLGQIFVVDLRQSCLERFGKERTPSKSAIYRFWQRARNRAPTTV